MKYKSVSVANIREHSNSDLALLKMKRATQLGELQEWKDKNDQYIPQSRTLQVPKYTNGK